MNGQIPNPPNNAQPEPTLSESLPSSPTLTNETPKGKKGLIFEFLFVLIVLVLVFVTLNYFNILKLSALFPNYLGFLPRKGVPTGTSQQSNNTTVPSTVSPTDQTKQALTSLLSTVITPSFIPKSLSDITVFQGKTTGDESIASWETQDGNQSARFVSSANGSQIIQLYILFDYNTKSSVSADLARKTVPQFISLAPKEDFSCKSLNNKANYCESFWTESDGTKRGIGIHEYSPFSSGTNKTTVFFCQFTKESKSYSWKSCAEEFAETGIR